jgi:hypothetical protein
MGRGNEDEQDLDGIQVTEDVDSSDDELTPEELFGRRSSEPETTPAPDESETVEPEGGEAATEEPTEKDTATAEDTAEATQEPEEKPQAKPTGTVKLGTLPDGRVITTENRDKFFGSEVSDDDARRMISQLNQMGGLTRAHQATKKELDEIKKRQAEQEQARLAAAQQQPPQQTGQQMTPEQFRAATAQHIAGAVIPGAMQAYMPIVEDLVKILPEDNNFRDFLETYPEMGALMASMWDGLMQSQVVSATVQQDRRSNAFRSHVNGLFSRLAQINPDAEQLTDQSVRKGFEEFIVDSAGSVGNAQMILTSESALPWIANRWQQYVFHQILTQSSGEPEDKASAASRQEAQSQAVRRASSGAGGRSSKARPGADRRHPDVQELFPRRR